MEARARRQGAAGRFSASFLWLVPTAVASPFLAAFCQLEATCWHGSLEIQPVAARLLWTAPVFAVMFGVWTRVREQAGGSFAVVRHVFAGVVVAGIIAGGVRVWASANAMVQLECRLVDVEQRPRDVDAWLSLGRAYERVAAEEYPAEWTTRSAPPAQRLVKLDEWWSIMREKAVDAYAGAARLRPSDWRPPEAIARVLFIEGECDIAGEFAVRARTRASALPDQRARSEALKKIDLLSLSKKLCDDLEASGPGR